MKKTLKDFFKRVVVVVSLLCGAVGLFFLIICVLFEPLYDIFFAYPKKIVGTWRGENDSDIIIVFIDDGRFHYLKDGKLSEKSFHHHSTRNHAWQIKECLLLIRVTPSSDNTFSYELKNNTLKLTCIKSDTLGYKSIFEGMYRKISNN